MNWGPVVHLEVCGCLHLDTLSMTLFAHPGFISSVRSVGTGVKDAGATECGAVPAHRAQNSLGQIFKKHPPRGLLGR